ncbi:MAG TPA: hypothetical protein VJ965_12710 [Anaerolineales bacterium]|nr:hypothetical protein [Anaerolineales bacterium]
MFWFAILLTIVSNVFYHVIQKVTPHNANPVLSLAVSYIISAVICVLLLLFFPMKDGLRDALQKLNWTSVALALTLVGLEVGFLLAYRAGWIVSMAGLVSNATVSILLLPVGMVLFSDKLSGTNVIGVLVTVVGLVLMNIGR